ncbi:MAG TPA: insulinase family protein, partial [Flavobacteriales bacterium]|nr:insulinase family protein [Flavobacteriales bacterium]
MNRSAMTARSIPCIIGSLLLPALMNAQIDRTKAPEPGPAPSVNLGSHKTFMLGNGMRVIVVENHKLPLVGVQVRFDNTPMVLVDRAGALELFGDVLPTGTSKHNKASIDLIVDGIGATFAASSDGVFGSSLKKH